MSLSIFNDSPTSAKYRNKIYTAESFYICPLDKIETVDSFKDLERVSFNKFLNDKLYEEDGISIEGIKSGYDKDGNCVETKIYGKIIYPVTKDNEIVTSEGIKFINSYIEDNKIKYRLLQIDDVKDKYILYRELSISSEISVLIKVSGDIFFNNKEEVEKYISNLKIGKCELSASRLLVNVNGKFINYHHYEKISKNENLNVSNSDFFDIVNYSCESSNKATYKFQKVFKLVPTKYIVVKI